MFSWIKLASSNLSLVLAMPMRTDLCFFCLDCCFNMEPNNEDNVSFVPAASVPGELFSFLVIVYIKLKIVDY